MTFFNYRRGYILPMTVMPLLPESVSVDNVYTYISLPISTYHTSELFIFATIGVLGGLLGYVCCN